MGRRRETGWGRRPVQLAYLFLKEIARDPDVHGARPFVLPAGEGLVDEFGHALGGGHCLAEQGERSEYLGKVRSVVQGAAVGTELFTRDRRPDDKHGD